MVVGGVVVVGWGVGGVAVAVGVEWGGCGWIGVVVGSRYTQPRQGRVGSRQFFQKMVFIRGNKKWGLAVRSRNFT